MPDHSGIIASDVAEPAAETPVFKARAGSYEAYQVTDPRSDTGDTF